MTSRFALRPMPLLVGLIVLFVALEFLFPRFADIDETVFKCAGRSLAAGTGFAAPEMRGFLHFDPPIERVYFAHFPVYPWLFGQTVRLCGFSWRSCVGYDAAISALLSVVVYGLTRALGKALGLQETKTAIAALITALSTLLLRQPARPDELAMIFSYANLWLLMVWPITPVIAALSGVFAGLSLCTSTGVFVGFVPVLAVCALWQINRRRIVGAVAVAAAGALVVIAICLVPLYQIDAHFYQQYFQHAKTVVATDRLQKIREELQHAWQLAPQRVFVLIGTLPLCLGACLRSWRLRPRLETIAIWAAPIVGALLLLFVRSAFTYWWFLQPWLLATSLLLVVQWRRTRARIVAVVWLACWVGLALAFPIRSYVIRCSLPVEQQLDASEQRLREIVPAEAVVLTAASWWSLAADHTVIDPNFSDIEDLRQIEFFVADGNGTGAVDRPRDPANPRYAAWLHNNFELVRDDLPRNRPRVGKLSIARGGYGFGNIIMRRTDPR